MSTTNIAPAAVHSTLADGIPARLAQVRATLENDFGVAFAMVDMATADIAADAAGAARKSSESLPPHWLELCREVARRRRPEFVADDDPLLALALPIPAGAEIRYVAVGLFLSRHPTDEHALAGIERTLGWNPTAVARWAAEQTPWLPSRLMALAEAVVGRLSSNLRLQVVENEVSELSANLAAMYEEISLLHRLTQHLRISESDEGLARIALEWLAETKHAESFALRLFPPAEADGSLQRGRAGSTFLTHGNCPVDETQFTALVTRLGLDTNVRSLVINWPASARQLQDFPAVRQLILVPLTEGKNLFGWLAAFGHSGGGEFGSPEANLLASVAAILGVHCVNTELYRQQADFLASMVRALTSAIDAKDPYTCGHSDRVAQIAVALATELGCDRRQLDTIYLSGLLHDIGKIGIDDSVLRKPGKLTEAEYEHIKTHTEIGYRILSDLKQLGDVLPVVRHHHEAWNGQGYPAKLSGEKIPLLARIVAVADSFDAMSSDRPYRKGMPDESLDTILRDGAGHQWDARVVAAFFHIRDAIREMSRRQSDCEPVVEEMLRLT
jgi:putative nucleotidyltransferase with HDIG domain